MPDSMKHLALSCVKNEKGFLKKAYHLLNYFLCAIYNKKIKNLKKLYVSNYDIKIDNIANSYFFKIPADAYDFSQYHNIKINKNEIAFRGVMSFEPNITAVRGFYYGIFLELIKIFPEISFKIIGKDPAKSLQEEINQNTHFTGFVDDVFEEMAAKNGWLCERSSSDELIFDIEGTWSDYHLSISWREETESLHLACTFARKTPLIRIDEVYRLVARINEQLWIGHFDLWPQDGSILYRHSLLLAGAEPSIGQCHAFIRAALESCEAYCQAFQFVIWSGKSAQDALTAAMLEIKGHA